MQAPDVLLSAVGRWSNGVTGVWDKVGYNTLAPWSGRMDLRERRLLLVDEGSSLPAAADGAIAAISAERYLESLQDRRL